MFFLQDGALLFLTLQLFLGRSLSIQLWLNPGALPTTIPASCRAVLSANITCSPQLVSARFVAGGGALGPATLNDYCTASCYNSLQTFKTNVDARCGDTLYQMYVNSTHMQSGKSVADPLAWAYNVTCIKDSTGFCLPDLYNGTKAKCSDCSLQYGAAMLSSDYGRAKVQPKAFSSLLSSCSVPESQYPYTYSPTSSSSPTSTTTSTPNPTCSGTKYTVGAQDTCQSISVAKSIAIDRLIIDNNLDYNCTTLKAGNTLCLGATCALQTVTNNQTCQDITNGQNYTSVQLVSWNPIIHPACDNLDSMVGRSICVSPPGSSIYSADPLNVTTAEMSSMFPGPYTTGVGVTSAPPFNTSWYNTQTTFAAPPTSTVTANATAASLEIARTSFCPISNEDLLDGWTVADLPDACESLVGPYCWPDLNAPVLPSKHFPAVCTPSLAASISTVTPSDTVPAPLEPSTVSSCKRYYQVLDGDNCYSIANNFNVTLTQFNTWNPYVQQDCSKLFLGYYNGKNLRFVLQIVLQIVLRESKGK